MLCSGEFVQVVSFHHRSVSLASGNVLCVLAAMERALAFLTLVPGTSSQRYMGFRAGDSVATEVPQAAAGSCRHRFSRGFRNLLSFPCPRRGRSSVPMPCFVLWFLPSCAANRNWASTVTVQGRRELKGAK